MVFGRCDFNIGQQQHFFSYFTPLQLTLLTIFFYLTTKSDSNKITIQQQ